MSAWLAPYARCELCPRRCGVDRTRGERGFCGETATCRLASACVHHGEEPPISAERGSGTVFLSGCSCRCFFCQNVQISQEGVGDDVSVEGLVDAALELVQAGVHNLNFVTPTHFWPHIRHAVLSLRQAGVQIPVVYNSSGYERAELVPQLAECADIFMPDMKFADSRFAEECMGDSCYPEFALSALRAMVEAKGFLEPWDPENRVAATEGVLVRHLVMPGHVDNSLAVLRLLRREFGRMLPLSIMSQFHPMSRCLAEGRLTRRISYEEYREVIDLAMELDFQSVFIQPHFGDPAFLPDFTQDEPFAR